MTALTYMAPLMGFPEMNIPKMLGDFMSVSVVVGWIAHFMIGTMFALIYVYVFIGRLPGAPWLKGALYGILPWFLAQIMVNPMIGAGVFAVNTPAPLLAVVGSLMGHLVYGGVLGAVYGSSGLRKSIPVPLH